MLKSSSKSSSTNSLYEFAEELTSFNKTNSKQEKGSNDIQSTSSDFSYSNEADNYEIASDITTSTADSEASRQNKLKTKYDLNEDMIFPS